MLSCHNAQARHMTTESPNTNCIRWGSVSDGHKHDSRCTSNEKNTSGSHISTRLAMAASVTLSGTERSGRVTSPRRTRWMRMASSDAHNVVDMANIVSVTTSIVTFAADRKPLRLPKHNRLSELQQDEYEMSERRDIPEGVSGEEYEDEVHPCKRSWVLSSRYSGPAR